MTDDLVAFLRARLTEDEALALEAPRGPWHIGNAVDPTQPCNVHTFPGAREVADGLNWLVAEHIVRHNPARVLAEVDAKRRIVDAHQPEWITVEWPDDQNGKGEAQVCRSCGNKDLDGWKNWRPAVGEAGVFPDGVRPPYIVAPCETLRLLALPYEAHPDYRPEWAPGA